MTGQLNKVLKQKDLEIKQRKKSKYWRDTNDYRLHQTFKWQLKLNDGGNGSVMSSPEKEVRIMTPAREHRHGLPEPIRPHGDEYPRSHNSHPYEESRPYRVEQNEPRTPKPWWKNNKKPRSKSPRKPAWKNNSNQKLQNPPNNQSGNQGVYAQGYQYDPKYQTQDRRDPRDIYQSQYQNQGIQSTTYQQGGPSNRDYYQQDNRRSPAFTQNKYEPLANYLEETNSRSSLEYRRNDRSPPRQEVP